MKLGKLINLITINLIKNKEDTFSKCLVFVKASGGEVVEINSKNSKKFKIFLIL